MTYYEKNKEKLKQYQREYASRHKEKMRQKQREYYAQNRVRLLARAKEWRENNPDAVRIRAKNNRNRNSESAKKTHQLYRDKYNALKESFGCMNPGCQWAGSYPGCILDFHHIDPATKSEPVSQLVCSPKKMRDEIRKCTCICAICHRLVTWGELEESSLPRCEIKD